MLLLHLYGSQLGHGEAPTAYMSQRTQAGGAAAGTHAAAAAAPTGTLRPKGTRGSARPAGTAPALLSMEAAFVVFRFLFLSFFFFFFFSFLCATRCGQAAWSEREAAASYGLLQHAGYEALAPPWPVASRGCWLRQVVQYLM